MLPFLSHYKGLALWTPRRRSRVKGALVPLIAHWVSKQKWVSCDFLLKNAPKKRCVHSRQALIGLVQLSFGRVFLLNNVRCKQMAIYKEFMAISWWCHYDLLPLTVFLPFPIFVYEYLFRRLFKLVLISLHFTVLAVFRIYLYLPLSLLCIGELPLHSFFHIFWCDFLDRLIWRTFIRPYHSVSCKWRSSVSLWNV